MENEHLTAIEAGNLCNEMAVDDPGNTRRLMDWINERQVERDVMFGGVPVPTLLRPNFLSRKQTEMLERVTVIIMNALEKIVRLYFESDVLHEVIRLSELEKEMVSIEPGIERIVVKSRLDAFLEGDSLRFLEFNCDSPAGVAYGEVQAEIFSETPFLKTVGGRFLLEQPQRMKMMHRALLDAYREYGGKEENPHIAITDWRDVKTIHEFHMLKQYFEPLGTPVTILDPRDFELAGGRLCAGGRPVDIVYRRVIIRELLEKEDEVQPFLEAYGKKLVCVANPFRSKVVSNKSTLAAMTDPAFDHLFTPEENEIKYRHVPWTRNLVPGEVEFAGRKSDVFDLAAGSKDGFVIKPADGYGGEDVFIGREVTGPEWEASLRRAADEDRTWVLQEYVDIPEEDFPIITDDGISLEKRKVNLNPFAIGGRYAGCISRISVKPIINVSAGGGMVPTFTVS